MSSSFSSSCSICSNVACRGGWNCGVLQILNRRKLQLLKKVEEGLELHPLCFHFLDLSNLHLKSLPRDYFLGIGNLDSFHLDLSGNDFETLPWWTFQHLERCVDLDLHNNARLSSVYDGLYSICRALRGSLNLSKCSRLDALNLDLLLGKSTSWRSIDLSSCGLRTLRSNAFSRMDRLDDLDLSNNRLRSVVLRIAQSRPTMWRVNLSENPIRYVDAQVENLQLDSCGLNSLEGLFSPAVKRSVELLGLTNNHLTQITCSDLTGFEVLTTLGLSNNKICRVEEGAFTQGCPVLEDLYLNDNRLTEIPANFFHFRFVSNVLLQNNDLYIIDPNAFTFTSKLRIISIELDVQGNPHLALAPPPNFYDVYSRDAISQYLGQLFEAQRLLTLAKKQSIFGAFHEELMMRVLEPARMERFVETHGMEAFMEVYA